MFKAFVTREHLISDRMWKLTCLVWVLGSYVVKVTGRICECHATGGCNFANYCRPAGNCRQRNVALGKSATVTSLFDNAYYNEISGPACLAVNGDTGTTFRPINHFPSNPACVHTAGGDTHPYWEVDLGQEFAVVEITVIGRTGFSTRLNYAKLSVDGKVNYSFPDPTPLQSDFKFDQPVLGRKVRVSQQWIFPNAKDPFFILCEVQVWACVEGYYGSSCSRNCGACLNITSCDAITGICTGGCDLGWQRAKCDETCPAGTYGNACILKCGNCSVGTVCHPRDGRCESGCAEGFLGHRCDQACPAGTYGKDCRMKCGNCSNGTATCNPTDGRCQSGCTDGFRGDRCEEACVGGYFGSDCGKRCGTCKNNASCDFITGYCPAGCDSGWQPPTCERAVCHFATTPCFPMTRCP